MRESLSCAGNEEREQIQKGQLEADMWKERSNVAILRVPYIHLYIYIYLYVQYDIALYYQTEKTWN